MKITVTGWDDAQTRAWVVTDPGSDSSQKVGVLVWEGVPGGWQYVPYIEATDQYLSPQQLPLERARLEALHREQIALSLGAEGPQRDALQAELDGRIQQLRHDALEGACFMGRVMAKRWLEL